MPQQHLTHFRAGRIFTANSEHPWAESLLIADGRIVFAGSTADAEAHVSARAGDGTDVEHTIELEGRIVLPGIVESHSHLVNLGRSLDQVDLLTAADLTEMQRRIAEATAERPDAPRVLGRSWLLAPLAGAQPHREMLDAVVADRPVYLVSNDLHSGWINTAALRELGIDERTPDPEGGTIVRDEHGDATGLLLETAALVLMRGGIEALENNSVRDCAVRAALASYRAAGVTAVADLGLRAAELAALERAWDAGELEIPVAGYLRVETSHDPTAITQQLTHAIETRDRLRERARTKHDPEPMLAIRGIKVWIDGVIDSGTAAMVSPFADPSRAAREPSRAAAHPRTRDRRRDSGRRSGVRLGRRARRASSGSFGRLHRARRRSVP